MKVLIDIMNFEIRAFEQKTDETVPTNEIQRIIYFESGGKYPEIIPENIFHTLPKSVQKKAKQIAGQIGASGIRGTLEVVE